MSDQNRGTAKEERRLRRILNFGECEILPDHDLPEGFANKLWPELAKKMNELTKTEVQELARLLQSINDIHTKAGYQEAFDKVLSADKIRKREQNLRAAAHEGLDHSMTPSHLNISVNPFGLTDSGSLWAEIGVDVRDGCWEFEIMFRCEQTYKYTEKIPSAGNQLLGARGDQSDNLSGVTSKRSGSVSMPPGSFSDIFTAASVNKWTIDVSSASGA